MTQIHTDPHQPDPSQHIIARHAISISAINPQLVIEHFFQEKLSEITASLQNEIDIYTEKLVIRTFKENISMEDYELKFYDFLCQTFSLEEISKLEELLLHPKKDPSASQLISTLLLGNKGLRDLIDEVFEQAIEETKDYFAKD